jgi:hypothetical protein
MADEDTTDEAAAHADQVRRDEELRLRNEALAAYEAPHEAI